jgi:spore germination protein KC
MKIRENTARTIIIGLILIMIFFTAGCHDAIEIDEMVYVVAMGLDSGTNGNVRMSMLLAVPIAVGVGPEPGELDKATTMITVEAPTIYGGMNIANSMMSKQLNFSHAKLVVISSDVAQTGIERYLNTFNRFREFRPNTFLGISIGLAEDFLRASKPILEANPAKYYELLMDSWKNTGFSVGSYVEDFYTDMRSIDSEAVAALLDVNSLEDSSEFEKILGEPQNEHKIMEGDYTAEFVPAVFDSKSINMGAAVFKGDKMVGELNGRETVYYLMVSGKLQDAYFTVPDPQQGIIGEGNEAKFVSLRLNLARKPVIQVEMKENTPQVTAHILLEGNILTAEGEKDYSSGEGLKQLEDFSAEYIREDILSFMEKTRDEFNSDICGAGKKMKQKFLFWDDWVRFLWAEKYQYAAFDVVTEVSIRRTGMTIKQIPMSSLK